jgi:hypothetical protein
MKLDPGMHIVMHLVFFGKTGVTAADNGAAAEFPMVTVCAQV